MLIYMLVLFTVAILAQAHLPPMRFWAMVVETAPTAMKKITAVDEMSVEMLISSGNEYTFLLMYAPQWWSSMVESAVKKNKRTRAFWNPKYEIEAKKKAFARDMGRYFYEYYFFYAAPSKRLSDCVKKFVDELEPYTSCNGRKAYAATLIAIIAREGGYSIAPRLIKDAIREWKEFHAPRHTEQAHHAHEICC